MFPEGKILLQSIPNMRVGEWFLYKEYTVIRIYGFEEETYKIQFFLTLRMLAMKYVIYSFISNDMHFRH